MRSANILFYFLFVLLLAGCRPKVKSSSDKLYEQYKEYGKIYADYGKVPIDSTLTKVKAFLQSFPQDAQAWCFYARLLYDQDKLEEAKTAYRKAITFNPRFALGYSGLGSIFNQANQNDSAEFYLQKAIELHDSSAYTFMNLAMLNMKLDRKEAALAFVDSSILTGDSSAAVFAGLSFVTHHLGQKDQSRVLLQIARDLGLKDSALFEDVLADKVKIDSFYKKNNY